MQADAHAQALGQRRVELLVEPVERREHVARSVDRVTARRRPRRRHAEQRHDAVAEKLVDLAAVALDRLLITSK